MTEDVGQDRTDRFRECCPWLMLVRGISLAMGLQVLLLATAGAIGASAGWRVVAQLTLVQQAESTKVPNFAAKFETSDDGVQRDLALFSDWPGSRSSAESDNRDAPFNIELAQASWLQRFELGIPPASPVWSVPYRIVRPFAQLLNRNLTRREYAFYFLGGFWAVVVWSFFGSAITRIAVLRLGREEPFGISDAVQHARERLAAHLAGCALPIGVALTGAIVMAAFGFVMRLGVGSLLGGLFWIFPLFISLAMNVALVGILFGWPLLWGAIDTERSDAFDGISRAYSYTYHRPLHYLGFAVFAAVLGLVGWLFVWLVSELIVQLSLVGVGLGAGVERVDQMLGQTSTDSSLVSAGGAAMRYWNGSVRTLASAYGFAYFWCAAAGIYLLLRYEVDSTELDDMPTDDFSNRFGLPRLANTEAKAPTDVR